MANSRKLYVFVLTCAFLYAMCMSALKVLSEPTTFEESVVKNHGRFPSFTICQVKHEMDNYTEFEDIVQASTFDFHIYALFEHVGRGVNTTAFILNYNSTLVDNFNITVEEVWSYGATIQVYPPYSILLCKTLNMDFIKAPPMQGEYGLRLYSLDSKGGYYVEKHEARQSLYNFEFDFSNTDILLGGKGYSDRLSVEETVALKTSSYDCVEDNSLNFTDCIDEFISDELGCSLPLSKLINGQEICSGSETLEQYRRIYLALSSNETMDRIRARGCFRTNCLTTKWTQSPGGSWTLNEGTLSVWFGLPSNVVTKRKQQILLANGATFLADCGSYLGLFLGASILSLSDIFIYLIRRVRRSLTRQT